MLAVVEFSVVDGVIVIIITVVLAFTDYVVVVIISVVLISIWSFFVLLLLSLLLLLFQIFPRIHVNALLPFFLLQMKVSIEHVPHNPERHRAPRKPRLLPNSVAGWQLYVLVHVHTRVRESGQPHRHRSVPGQKHGRIFVGAFQDLVGDQRWRGLP